MNFELLLVEEKVNRQQVMALHFTVIFSLIVTGVFLLTFPAFLNSIPTEKRLLLLDFTISKGWGIAILLSGIFFFFATVMKSRLLLEKKILRTTRIVELLIMLVFSSFAAMHDLMVPAFIYGLIAGALLFALYWESVSDNALYIRVDERGVRLPITSRKRFLEWREIQQMLLRFSILTIDCCDNRLFQWNIRSIDFDKDSFQHFCNEHIAASREKAKKPVW